MTVRLEDSDIRPQVISIAASDGSERQQLIGEFITYLEELELLHTWAASLARKLGRNTPEDVDEFHQVITVGLLERLRDITVDEVNAIAEDRLGTHLYHCGKRSATVWVDSPATTIAAGMSGISRRNRESWKHRHDYVREHGADPTDQELVDHINTKVTASRKNAVKQGAIVTLADVQGTALNAYSMDYTPAGGTDSDANPWGTPTESDDVEQKALLAVTMKQLASIAEDMFGFDGVPSIGEVLESWSTFVSAGVSPTLYAIADDLEVERKKVAPVLRNLEAAFVEFRERYA